MVTKRLEDRYNASQKERKSCMRRVGSACAAVPAVLCGCGPALYQFASLGCCNRPKYPKKFLTSRMYVHMVCSIKTLKSESRKQGCSSLNNFINAAFVHAFLAGDAEINQTTFAINCVSDFKARVGNGTCIKVLQIR